MPHALPRIPGPTGLDTGGPRRIERLPQCSPPAVGVLNRMVPVRSSGWAGPVRSSGLLVRSSEFGVRSSRLLARRSGLEVRGSGCARFDPPSKRSSRGWGLGLGFAWGDWWDFRRGHAENKEAKPISGTFMKIVSAGAITSGTRAVGGSECGAAGSEFGVRSSRILVRS